MLAVRLGHFVKGMLKNGCPYEYPVQSVGTVGTLVLVSVMSGVHTDLSINASDSARIRCSAHYVAEIVAQRPEDYP